MEADKNICILGSGIHGPCIDGVFLKGPPEEVLKNKEFLKVPMVVEVVNHEFGWIMPQASSLAFISCCEMFFKTTLL